jgi:hypothetical protein
VPRAQQSQVVDVGRAVVAPPLVDVVGVRPAHVDAAAGERAVPVADLERPPQPGWDGAVSAPDVKDLVGGVAQPAREVVARAAPTLGTGDPTGEHRGDVGVAEHPLDRRRRQQDQVVDAGDQQVAAQPREEGVEVDRERHVRGHPVTRPDRRGVEHPGQPLPQREREQVRTPVPRGAEHPRDPAQDTVSDVRSGVRGGPVRGVQRPVTEPAVDDLVEHRPRRRGALVGGPPRESRHRPDARAGQRLVVVRRHGRLRGAVGVHGEAEPVHRTAHVLDRADPSHMEQDRLGVRPLLLPHRCRQTAQRTPDPGGQLPHRALGHLPRQPGERRGRELLAQRDPSTHARSRGGAREPPVLLEPPRRGGPAPRVERPGQVQGPGRDRRHRGHEVLRLEERRDDIGQPRSRDLLQRARPHHGCDAACAADQHVDLAREHHLGRDCGCVARTHV